MLRAAQASMSGRFNPTRQASTTTAFSALKRPMSLVATWQLPKLPSTVIDKPCKSSAIVPACNDRSASHPEPPAPTHTAVSGTRPPKVPTRVRANSRPNASPTLMMMCCSPVDANKRALASPYDCMDG